MRAITKPECLMSKSLFYKSFPGRNIIRKIASWFSSYMETFSKKLMGHFENEYEVQIRNGKITETGERTLKRLSCEFEALQFRRNISNMFSCLKTTYKSYMNTKPHIHDLLDVVHDDLVHEVHLYVFKTQQDVLKNRRAKTNMLCRDKSSAGPSVFNFTEHTSWDELSSHLASSYGYITTQF